MIQGLQSHVRRRGWVRGRGGQQRREPVAWAPLTSPEDGGGKRGTGTFGRRGSLPTPPLSGSHLECTRAGEQMPCPQGADSTAGRTPRQKGKS